MPNCIVWVAKKVFQYISISSILAYDETKSKASLKYSWETMFLFCFYTTCIWLPFILKHTWQNKNRKEWHWHLDKALGKPGKPELQRSATLTKVAAFFQLLLLWSDKADSRHFQNSVQPLDFFTPQGSVSTDIQVDRIWNKLKQKPTLCSETVTIAS